MKAVKTTFLYERLISLFSFAYPISTDKAQGNNCQSTDANHYLLPPLEAVHLLNLGDLFGADNLNWNLHTINLDQCVNSHLIIIIGVVVIVGHIMPSLNDGGVTFNVVVDTIPINHRITHLDRVTHDVHSHVLGVVFLGDHHWLLNIFGDNLLSRLASVTKSYHKADNDAYRKSEEQLTTASYGGVLFHHTISISIFSPRSFAGTRYLSIR